MRMVKGRGATVAFRETFWLALDALRAHKLRSFLTLLGVILAVMTLVAVMSIVEGLNRYVATKIANLGSNVFVVNQFGITTSFEEFLKARKRPPIGLEDYYAVRDRLRLAKQVATGDDNRTPVRYGNELLEDVSLLGTTPNFAEVRGIEVGLGRFFTEADNLHRAPVCFIGNDLVNRFFPGVDPIGKTLRVGPQTCEVVGVAKTMGSVFGQSRDNFIFLPLGTYMKTWFRPGDSLFILVQAIGPEYMDDAADEVRVLLRARRHVSYSQPDNFGVIMPSSITGLFERLTGNIFAVAVGLTSIFLVASLAASSVPTSDFDTHCGSPRLELVLS